MNDILLSPLRLSELETLIEKSVRRAISQLLSDPTPKDQIGGIELAAQITRLSKARIYTLVSERAIPHKKRGNRLYFNRTELIAWVEQGNRKERGGLES
ncbi:AlpA family transcriptional regulator [Larkinella arboricola]|uniref:AlpA family transcriptional regulator n=1 Tax=Larkinella arboricola TaxID=643671 RepID=A0A327X7E5_LARAB|nr:helix-turn-helix domain-containing protein [Larkinella arboricola]RAK02895.1 AlpA family transcriptional regulator [Larkinella arboricola]